MKKMLTFCCAALLAVQFMACSKKDSSTANPNQGNNDFPIGNSTQVPLVDTSFIDPWECTALYQVDYDSTGKITNEEGANQQWQTTYMGTYDLHWQQVWENQIVFNADHTYSHSNAYNTAPSILLATYMPTTGKWQIKDTKTLSLEMKDANGSTYMKDFHVASHTVDYLHITDSGTNKMTSFDMEFQRK